MSYSLLLSLGINFVVANVIIQSTIGENFKNLTFSFLLRIICLKFYLIDSIIHIKHFSGALYPLIAFIDYHIVRCVYWYKYKKEMIPLSLSKWTKLRYSKLEQRKATKIDKNYMFLCFGIGLAIMLLFSYLNSLS